MFLQTPFRQVFFRSVLRNAQESFVNLSLAGIELWAAAPLEWDGCPFARGKAASIAVSTSPCKQFLRAGVAAYGKAAFRNTETECKDHLALRLCTHTAFGGLTTNWLPA